MRIILFNRVAVVAAAIVSQTYGVTFNKQDAPFTQSNSQLDSTLECDAEFDFGGLIKSAEGGLSNLVGGVEKDVKKYMPTMANINHLIGEIPGAGGALLGAAKALEGGSGAAGALGGALSGAGVTRGDLGALAGLIPPGYGLYPHPTPAKP